MRIHTTLSILALGALTACAAAPNPERSRQPAPWRPSAPAATSTGDAAAAEANPTRASEANASASAAATQADAKQAEGGGRATGAANAPAGTTPTEPVVARVAGESIYVSELLTQWLYLDSLRVLDQLRNLAMGRLVLIEAERLHVTLSPDSISKAYDTAVSEMESEIAKSEIGRKSPGLNLDRYVDRVLGLDPIRYRERLREDAVRALLGERTARAWLLTQEHCEIHVIVTSSEEDVKAAQKDLADGVSFEEVARKRSKDPSARDGGWITPIVKGDTPLGKLAFATSVGQVGGPVTDSGAWLLVRVDARPTPLVGDWAQIGPQVESSLAKRGVEALEVKQWHSAMLAKHEVDLQPFLDLVREPRR